ncbi:hypothetical protein [Enterococcus faecium]|uniref:Uncharacterized protein n=1 Tax=Enterococcus faecium TaxID=1352 RepID=A0A242B0V9_ENTFC|nr:hypothetical protein [Enterococcus faecium]OTN86785.1 hypothetical protein A5810_002908 [Enterococcus faecium]OTN86808.1 hypothetical protein A5810_002878 [Enterococcus faecium]
MRQWFRCFSLLGVLLIGFSVFVSAGTSVYAAEKVNQVPDIETQKQQAVESLKFYLEEAGYVDTETHRYVVTDLEAIQKKADLDGSEGIAGKFCASNGKTSKT